MTNEKVPAPRAKTRRREAEYEDLTAQNLFGDDSIYDNNGGNPWSVDSIGHETHHVAGIVAAADKSIGVVGVTAHMSYKLNLGQLIHSFLCHSCTRRLSLLQQ